MPEVSQVYPWRMVFAALDCLSCERSRSGSETPCDPPLGARSKNRGVPLDQPVAVMAHGLTKAYGPVQALRGVDLEVRRGEIFGFLGPNGSGKTTTIRCLLDLIRPSSGFVRVLGLDPQAEPVAVRARVGYLPGELRLDDNMTPLEVLRYFNRLRGDRAGPAFIRQLAGRLNLDLNTPIKNF